MTSNFKAGDEVSWKSHGSTARGKVVRKLTSHIKIKNHDVAASADNPEYVVETEDGNRAAHKAEALTRR
jgi:hypothetical protein